jgi:hypothetical protein
MQDILQERGGMKEKFMERTVRCVEEYRAGDRTVLKEGNTYSASNMMPYREWPLGIRGEDGMFLLLDEGRAQKFILPLDPGKTEDRPVDLDDQERG